MRKMVCVVVWLIFSASYNIATASVAVEKRSNHLRRSNIDNDLLKDVNANRLEEEMIWSSDLFEGDIVTSKEQLVAYYGKEASDSIEAAGLLERSKRIISQKMKNENQDQHNRNLGVFTDYDWRWMLRDANNILIIPYQFQANMPSNERQVILDAIDHIETLTGIIKFRTRTNEVDYIYFQNTEDGCWSYVGRVGGKQEINVVNQCGFGAAVHEIYHALGFQHEQSRSDRDSYVTILTQNIQAGMEGNFEKAITNGLGSAYDYGSIMHYGATDFGITSFLCTATEVKSNTVARIKFQKSTVDSNQEYCFNVNNGNTALANGQVVNLRPCGENSFVNQDWIIEAFGVGFNVIRFALDPTYCLTVNVVNNVSDEAPLVVKQCLEGNFTDQHFAFDHFSWEDITFIWGTDFGYAITRSKTASSAQTYPLILKDYGFESWTNQIFPIEFVSKTTGRSAAVNSFCQLQTQKTIESNGNAIGQRSGLSAQDILQLQLLYQCPSGPRNLNSFCSTDCKCKNNQGACTSDDQCEAGLSCMPDGVSMNRCLTNLNPTKSPTTKSPTPSAASPLQNRTPSPTASPISTTSMLIGIGVAVPLVACAIAGVFLIVTRSKRQNTGSSGNPGNAGTPVTALAASERPA